MPWIDENRTNTGSPTKLVMDAITPPDWIATGGYTSCPPAEVMDPEGAGPADEPVSDPYKFTVEATFDTRYARLRAVLDAAFKQAAEGKGEERHGDSEPFERQLSCRINRRRHGFALGQAEKKIDESDRLPTDARIRELLGAINFIAIEIITLEDETQAAG